MMEPDERRSRSLQRYEKMDNILFIFITMQKLIEKSLRTTVLQQISKLNIANAEFYAMLRKLNSTEMTITETFAEKLQSMKLDIRNKIKQLAANVDLMYQMFDRKIALLIRKIDENYGSFNHFQQQLKASRTRIKELEDETRDAKNKYSAALTQNQYLKNKNIALIEELESLNKRKAQTTTNDSSRDINQKTNTVDDYDNSLQGYGSPLQTQIKPVNFSNDLTFNKNLMLNNLSNNNKKIKSQQNSFSSLLIKQQNSFEPSYGSDRKEASRFAFGCMPVRNLEEPVDVKFEQNRKRNTTKQDQSHNVSHRMSFLINNLKQSDQSSFVSSSSSRYHFSRDQSPNKSVLSKGAVKKYHI